MNIYTATAEFSFSQIGILVQIGDTIGKITARSSVYVGGAEYADKAAFNWIGTVDSLNYMTAAGTTPDPSTGSAVTGGTAALTGGTTSKAITGAGFSDVPSAIVVTVVKPLGSGSNLFGTVRADSITADGFTVDLSGPVPGAGYSISYFAI
jgi:hypothetical protein